MTDTPLPMPAVHLRKVAALKPYEGNPREITQEAVDAVKESLATFGYQQPIVVDTHDVVVLGHTRLLALKELGVTDVEVYVTDLPPEKVKEFRLVDNRLAELGQWDHSLLVTELRELEEGLVDRYFPEIDLEVGTLTDTLVKSDDIERAAAKVSAVHERKALITTRVECPACLDTFEVTTDSLPGVSTDDLRELNANGTAQ